MGEHPLTRVHQAVEECITAHLISAEAVIARTRSLAAIEATTRGPAPRECQLPTAVAVQVPLPDLSRFDQLLSGHTNRDDSIDEVMTISHHDTSAASPVSVFCT